VLVLLEDVATGISGLEVGNSLKNSDFFKLLKAAEKKKSKL